MLKKIHVTDLRLGMHVHELCGSWMDHPFWRTNFKLQEAADLRRITESGIKDVWIDTAKGLDVANGEAQTREQVDADIAADLDATGAEPLAPRPVSQHEELQRAAKICATAKAAVCSMFEEARMGKAIDSDKAGAMVTEISASVMRNSGALINLARIKTSDDYTYLHSVAVCALMIALARQLGLSEADTYEAGMAGLLHDLGKALIPSEVLNKPGKLTDEEFAIVKQHPVAGHRLLVEGQNVGAIALDVCLHHHEKVDGSGYPERLSRDRISLFARMGAVCDVYDAITSNRAYKSGWDPAVAIQKMTEWCNGHFDTAIFHAFVKSIGIYPVGSLVRLSSGRLGVVTEQNGKSLLTPLVKVFYSTKAQSYLTPEIIDLSQPGHTEQILGREEAEQWGFKNLETYWLPAN